MEAKARALTAAPVKVALVVGHEPGAPGADGMFMDGVHRIECNEYAYNVGLAGMVKQALAGNDMVEIVDVRRHLVGGYSKLPAWINARQFDVAIELHYNSAASSSAGGTEMLYWHTSVRSKLFAAIIQGRVLGALKLKDRGTKAITAKDRGAPFLRGTACPAVICEPFFGSNADEMRIAWHGTDKLAAAYVLGILDIALWLKSQKGGGGL